MGACSVILWVILTVFLPPIGVLMVAGCGADFLINIVLTILGYFPGHIHAFYIGYMYYDRKHNGSTGRAPGIFSEKVQNAGRSAYIAPAAQPAAAAAPPVGQPAYGQPAYGQPAYGQPGYGQPAYRDGAYDDQAAPAYGKTTHGTV